MGTLTSERRALTGQLHPPPSCLDRPGPGAPGHLREDGVVRVCSTAASDTCFAVSDASWLTLSLGLRSQDHVST